MNAYLEVILATTIWGLTGFFVRTLNLHPVFVTFFRLSAPALVLMIYFIIKKDKNAFKLSKNLTLSSLISLLGLFLYFTAFSLTSIGNVVILFYTNPIWTIIFGKYILKEEVKKEIIFMLPIAFLGMVLIFINKKFSFNSLDFIGMILAVISAILFSLVMIITKKEGALSSNYKIIFHQNMIGTIFILPLLFLFPPYPDLIKIGIGGVYGILVGLVGFILYYSALKRTNTSIISLMSYFEVVTSVFFAAILLKEYPTWNTIIGAILIIIPKTYVILISNNSPKIIVKNAVFENDSIKK